MLIPKYRIFPDWSTGETFFAQDITAPYDAEINLTGWGGVNTNILAVNAMRFVWSSYLKEQQAGTSTTISAGVEYSVGGSGSFTFDSKTISAGSTVIFMTSGTPTLSNCTLTETGRFCSVTDFLPVDVDTDNFTPSLLGIDSLIFPDSSYTVQSDVFTTAYTAQAGIPAGTYIVIGSSGQTITVSGNTYRIGEIFTAVGSFTATGTATIVRQSDTGTTNFLLAYYAWAAIIDMQNRLATGCCNCKDKLRANLVKAANIWADICNQYNDETGSLDPTSIQIGLDEIVRLNTDATCQ